MLWKRKAGPRGLRFRKSQSTADGWLRQIAERAGLLKEGVFISKQELKDRKYLGSGGIGMFRDTLWAGMKTSGNIRRSKPETITKIADEMRSKIFKAVGI